MADPGKENIQAAAAAAAASATWEDLPEPIVEHIQSFLPVKDAIRSCLISKSSLHEIPTSPDLILDLDLDPTNEHSVDQITKLSTDFVKFIGKTMAKYRKQNLPIHRFDLNLVFALKQSASVTPLLRDWLRIATTSGLKHLAVQADCLDVLWKQQIQILSVRGCDMVNLSYLVSLFLRHIHFEDEKAIAKIFSNLPQLEKIRVVRCTGDALRRVRVTKVPRLRELDFSSVCNEVLIVDKAPALVSLSHVETVPENASVLILKAVRYRLKSLTLESSGFYRNLWAELVSELAVLEDFSIRFRRPPTDQTVKLASNSIKRLKIKHSCQYLIIQLYAPKLVLLSYDGPIVPTLISPSNNSMQMKFRMSIDHVDSFYHLYWSRLCELLSKTGQSDVSIGMSELVTMNESFRGDLDFLRSLPSPAKNVKNVRFTGIVCEEGMFPIVLDCVFSVCHPEFACMTCFDDNVPFMRFLVTKLMGKRHKRCCCDSVCETKCWRHYLKKGSEIEFRPKACGLDDEEGWQPLPFRWRDFIKGPADKREGCNIRIRLSWSDRPF